MNALDHMRVTPSTTRSKADRIATTTHASISPVSTNERFRAALGVVGDENTVRLCGLAPVGFDVQFRLDGEFSEVVVVHVEEAMEHRF